MLSLWLSLPPPASPACATVADTNEGGGREGFSPGPPTPHEPADATERLRGGMAIGIGTWASALPLLPVGLSRHATTHARAVQETRTKAPTDAPASTATDTGPECVGVTEGVAEPVAVFDCVLEEEGEVEAVEVEDVVLDIEGDALAVVLALPVSEAVPVGVMVNVGVAVTVPVPLAVPLSLGVMLIDKEVEEVREREREMEEEKEMVGVTEDVKEMVGVLLGVLVSDGVLEGDTGGEGVRELEKETWGVLDRDQLLDSLAELDADGMMEGEGRTRRRLGDPTVASSKLPSGPQGDSMTAAGSAWTRTRPGPQCAPLSMSLSVTRCNRTCHTGRSGGSAAS